MARIAALIVVIGATLAASPVAAQFGNPFSDSPPRPPADVPNGGFPAQPPPVQYPGQYPSQQQYPAQQQAPPQQQYPAQPQYPAQQYPASGKQRRRRFRWRVGPPASRRSRCRRLPVHRSAPANANRGAAPAAAPPQAPRLRRRRPMPPPPQPSDTATAPTSPGQEDDTTVIETPTEKIENGRAVFAGLDKITGRTIKFDAAIGETVQFGALQVTARACYTRPPTEPTNTDAFVEVDEVTLQGEIKRIFTGWMFAVESGAQRRGASDLRRLADGLRTAADRPGRGINADAAAAGHSRPGAGACASASPPAARRQAQPPRQPVKPPAAESGACPPTIERSTRARRANAVSPDTGRSSDSAAKFPSPTSAASSSL